jgi:flagellar biosynthesis protein FlhG
MTPRKATARIAPVPAVQVIAVTGGKGGTGKTTVSVNLATALAQAGRKVLLLDGDLGLANVDVLLGLTPACTLEQVLSGQRTLEEILLRTRAGVAVIPSASGVSRMAKLSVTEHAAIVRAFSTLPGDFDTLVVDTAPGLSESVLTFAGAAQQQLIVIRNEPASLTDAYALIKVLSREQRVHHFRILVNMARSGSDPQALFKRLQRVTDRFLEVVLDYAGEIPEDEMVAKAVRTQRTVVEAYPAGAAARAYRRLAQAAQGWAAPQVPAGGLEFYFERMLPAQAARLRVVK